MEKVKSLLKENPNLVFSKDNNSQTPLAYAAGNGHKDVVALLLANGAEINVKNGNGYTPLHEAVINGHTGVVALLLAHGADANVSDVLWGMSPLDYAASRDHKEIVELLLDHGADVNAKNRSGFTPLQLASAGGNNAMVELLRQHGNHVQQSQERRTSGDRSSVGTADIAPDDLILIQSRGLTVTRSEDIAKLIHTYGFTVSEVLKEWDAYHAETGKWDDRNIDLTESTVSDLPNLFLLKSFLQGKAARRDNQKN